MAALQASHRHRSPFVCRSTDPRGSFSLPRGLLSRSESPAITPDDVKITWLNSNLGYETLDSGTHNGEPSVDAAGKFVKYFVVEDEENSILRNDLYHTYVTWASQRSHDYGHSAGFHIQHRISLDRRPMVASIIAPSLSTCHG